MPDPLNWTHVLVCAMHKNGWWDGDDPVASNYPLANPAGYVITPNPRMETFRMSAHRAPESPVSRNRMIPARARCSGDGYHHRRRCRGDGLEPEPRGSA